MKKYKVGDKIIVKNLLKVKYPFLGIGGGKTKVHTVSTEDDIVFRGLKLGHLKVVEKEEIVEKPTKKKVKRRR